MAQDDNISMREFFDFRISSLENKLDKNQMANEKRIEELSQAIARLASAIVSRETIDELRKTITSVTDRLHTDLVKTGEGQEDLEDRVTRLESQAAIIKWVMGGAWTVLLAVVVDKLRQML